jgi:hypothetical protein
VLVWWKAVSSAEKIWEFLADAGDDSQGGGIVEAFVTMAYAVGKAMDFVQGVGTALSSPVPSPRHPAERGYVGSPVEDDASEEPGQAARMAVNPAWGAVANVDVAQTGLGMGAATDAWEPSAVVWLRKRRDERVLQVTSNPAAALDGEAAGSHPHAEDFGTPADFPPYQQPPLQCQCLGSMRRNFAFMSLCFALNHACIVGCLTLSTALLGPKLGNVQASVLYAAYTLTALLLAAGIVQTTGAKHALVGSTFAFCCYPASFFLGIVIRSNIARNLVVCAGALVGGIAAGILFTAYGTYFATACARFVEEPLQRQRGTTMQQATSVFSGVFASIYLLCETLFKVLATLIPRNFSAGRSIILITYSITAVVAAASMTLINPLELMLPLPLHSEQVATARAGTGEAAQPSRQQRARTKKLFAAITLFATDCKMPLLSGINLAFGFASAYLTSYLNGTVVKETKGWEYIGYYSAITPVVAGLVAVPLGWLGKHYSQTPVMLIGSLSFVFMLLPAVGPTQLPVETISRTPVLVGVYALEGTARCVFEGANRAVFADFFPDHREAAFATIVWQSGGASTIAFFLLSRSSIDPSFTAVVGLFFALASIPAYLIANKLLKAQVGE